MTIRYNSPAFSQHNTKSISGALPTVSRTLHSHKLYAPSYSGHSTNKLSCVIWKKCSNANEYTYIAWNKYHQMCYGPVTWNGRVFRHLVNMRGESEAILSEWLVDCFRWLDLWRAKLHVSVHLFSAITASQWNKLHISLPATAETDWVRLNVPPTQYRSYGDGFLRVKWPNQQCQSTEGTHKRLNQIEQNITIHLN